MYAKAEQNMMDMAARYGATSVRTAMPQSVVTEMVQPVIWAVHSEAANPASLLMVRKRWVFPRARWRARTKQAQIAVAAATWAQNSWGSSMLAATGMLEMLARLEVCGSCGYHSLWRLWRRRPLGLTASSCW
jgi:hypothetical protein